MPTEITLDPTNRKLVIHIGASSTRVEVQGTALTMEDQALICKIDPSETADIEIEHDDPSITTTAGHYDAQQQWHSWGTSPCRQVLGLTGGFVDVMAVGSSAGQQQTKIIKIDIRTKTDKPF